MTADAHPTLYSLGLPGCWAGFFPPHARKEGHDELPTRLSEKSAILAAASGAAGTGLLGSATRAYAGGTAKHIKDSRHSGSISQRNNGTYDTVELAKRAWTLCLVQSPVDSFPASEAQAGRKRNLKRMLQLIDGANYMTRPDLIQFHEFPLTGWRRWTRKEALKVCIEVPGEETEALAAKAKKYGNWIVFGAYVRDPDWPGHVISMNTFIDDKGKVVGRQWKACNISVSRFWPGVELFTTSIYDVLDRYVEMYGRDAVIPVLRTPLGNLAASSSQLTPELFRAMAIKGTEVFLRTASGGFSPADVAACAMYNGVYSSIVNNSISTHDKPFPADVGAGGTAIYNPRGKVLRQANSPNETFVRGRIPIARLRSHHQQPVMHADLFREIFEDYQGPYPPNLFSKYDPKSLHDAYDYLKDKSRWK